MKIQSIIALGLSAFLLTGCYYTQPGNVGTSSPYNGTTAIATLGGAAGGAFAGNAINKDYGAPIGAAVGAAAAGGLTALLQAKQQKELLEAYEEGQRVGRAQVFDEWWEEHAILNDPLDQQARKGPKTRQIQLPAGEYESVPYLNRTYEYMVSPK